MRFKLALPLSFAAMTHCARGTLARGICEKDAKFERRNTALDCGTYLKRPGCPITSRGLFEVSLRGGTMVNGRGGHQSTARHRRSLTRFLVPTLVWIVCLAADHALWKEIFPAVRTIRAALRAYDGDDHTDGMEKVLRASFRALLALTLSSHLSVVVSDPGIVRKNAQWKYNAERNVSRWCNRCHAYKPPRAHHCSRCRTCVEGMDHHCTYAANCIGKGNFRRFLILLIASALLALCGVISTLRMRSVVSLDLRSCEGHTQMYDQFGHAGCQVPISLNRSPKTVMRSTTAMLVSFLVVFTWIIALVSLQLYGIVVDMGMIDRMQVSSRHEQDKTRTTTNSLVGDIDTVPQTYIWPA